MLDPSDVLHISAGNRSYEILGQGVLSQYAQALGQQMTAEEWSARYLAGRRAATGDHPSRGDPDSGADGRLQGAVEPA